MYFTCNKIEPVDIGIGVQVEFKNLDGDSEKYLIIQKHFEDDEDFSDEVSYIELYDLDLAGHYRTEIELDRSKCTFKFGGSEVTIKYQIRKKKFEELKDFLKIPGSII